MYLARTLLAVCCCLLPVVALAQSNAVAARLGQTKDTGSLPLWSSPGTSAVQQLGKFARESQRGIMLVGHPKVATGSAWVISKKHRLLVTNAHVADIFAEAGNEMFAIPSGTSELYVVEKVWYHPGVQRFSKELGGLPVRESDPGKGDIFTHSPDLAILQLSPDGPELTVEFPLATEEELANLFAQPVAIMGFPGHDTKGWPALGQKAAATFHEGVISRITDFEMGTSAPQAELQFLQYTMATWPGFSGSPVFLPNGRVAGVHNCAPPEEGRFKQIITIPHGIRTDSVLEMFVHHGLEDKLPIPVDKSKLLVKRWTEPDPKTELARERFSKATAIVLEAEKLARFKKQFPEAEKLCNEAIELAPQYARAYYVRALTRVNFKFENSDRLSPESALSIVQSAFEDARKAAQLDPSDPPNVIMICTTLNQLGYTAGNQGKFRESLAIVQEMLKSTNLPNEHRARALSMRANALDNLGDVDAAWRDHTEAVRLAPENPNVRDNRGRFLRSRELGDYGEADLAAASAIRAKEK